MTASTTDSETPDPANSKPRLRSSAEWISLLIASIILAFVVGVVSYLWIRDRNQQHPVLELLSVGEPRQASGHYYVSFVVTNTGGKTAEAVQVVAELQIEGRLIESGEQQIDFLSRQEKAEGAFIFSQDPSQGAVTIRVASYKLP